MYLAAEMPWWQAINHGMTVISTGGFTVTSGSFAGYSNVIKVMTLFLIVLGAISFRAHYQLIRHGNVAFLLRQTEFRYFSALLLIGFVLLLILNDFSGHAPAIDMLFQWVSSLGTCGFSTTSVGFLHPAIVIVLAMGMIIGGTSGSTTGGLKMNRIAWLAKGIALKLRKVRSDKPKKEAFGFDGQDVEIEEGDSRIRSAAVLLSLWIITLILSSILLFIILGKGARFSHLLFESASALGNVGLSTGITGPELTNAAKGVLIMLMWFGRLEIIAVLALLLSPFKARSK